ncbi:MAG: FliI/YscN family ATPase [Gammaproteobacteria bacterium]|nr:FliI/YscN family ATPase [Gammaproteobacteria bacterium]
MANSLHSILDDLPSISLTREVGRVIAFDGAIIKVTGVKSIVGAYCSIRNIRSSRIIKGQCIAFNNECTIFMPFEKVIGISINDEVVVDAGEGGMPIYESMEGKCFDAFMSPLEQEADQTVIGTLALYPERLSPLRKERCKQHLLTGVKTIDACLPLAKGQRTGIFSGSGVGKTTLFRKLIDTVNVDIKIIVLIGERGREVSEILEQCKETNAPYIIIASSADQPAVHRAQALYTGTALAEHYAEQGKDVALYVDSITRFAHALREVKTAAGESASLRGYPSSVFTELASLAERAGNFKDSGSITGIYTVLVDGDDLDEPISDNMRAILDGHIILSRAIADQGQFPAVDVLKSRSRIILDVFNEADVSTSEKIRKTLASYVDVKDFVDFGGYKKGSNKKIDLIIESYEKLIEKLFSNHGYHQKDLKELLNELIK